MECDACRVLYKYTSAYPRLAWELAETAIMSNAQIISLAVKTNIKKEISKE